MSTTRPFRRCPHLLEISARLLVERRSRELGRRATLLDVPDAHWREIADRGFDLVWLMGVWRRSPGSRRAALADAGLRSAYDEALPGWTAEDVAGSPYAVAAYELDSALGAAGDLAAVRRRLNDHGLGLVLDFVPNHLALDHAWTESAPERFVSVAVDGAAAREGFFRVGDRAIAHGRDPYFPPWTDTAQVNAFAPEGRRALIDALLAVAAQADGIRCDMAMLLLNEVFARTWGEMLSVDAVPATEFWTEAVTALRERHPALLLIAEAYWDLGWRLHELGFDAFYDKTLYDRLRSGEPESVRAHLAGTAEWYDCAVRFIENHDEPRAASAFPAGMLAALVTVLTVPGIRLIHDGQQRGRRLRLPVQLVCEPDETPDPVAQAAHERVLEVCDDPVFHEGSWSMLDVRSGGNAPLAWCWRHGRRRRVVGVNVTGAPAEGTIMAGPAGGDGPVRDALEGLAAAATRVEPARNGWRVALPPHGACILALPE